MTRVIGRGLINPLPLVFTALHLLRDMGQGDPAQRLHDAIVKVLTTNEVRTPDLGGMLRRRQWWRRF